jgi:cell wall assembly regulator SMI1
MNALKELKEWLSSNLPEVANCLAMGASDQDIEKLRTVCDREIPSSLINLFLWHNGQKEDAPITGIWYGLNFFNIDQLHNEVNDWKNLVSEFSSEDMVQMSSFSSSIPVGFIKPIYSNNYWIPFAHDGCGNYLGIDLDPDTDGTYGQVINFGRDENNKYVISESLESFFDWYVNELKNGNFMIRTEEDGGKSFNTKIPESHHFLDSLSELFSNESIIKN